MEFLLENSDYQDSVPRLKLKHFSNESPRYQSKVIFSTEISMDKFKPAVTEKRQFDVNMK